MDIVDATRSAIPPADLIEQIGYASGDEFFKKPQFWRSLIEYRKYGLRPTQIVETNVHKELYHIRNRLNKLLVGHC